MKSNFHEEEILKHVQSEITERRNELSTIYAPLLRLTTLIKESV